MPPSNIESLIEDGPVSEETLQKESSSKIEEIQGDSSGDTATFDEDAFKLALGESVEPPPKSKEEPISKPKEEVIDKPKEDIEEPPQEPQESQEAPTSEDFSKKLEDLDKTETVVESPVSDIVIPENISKKMATEARDFLLAEMKRRSNLQKEFETFKKASEGKKSVPTSWYDHENAFVLDPEYQKAISTGNQLDGIISHFQEQLVKIKEGDNWKDVSLDTNNQLTLIEKKSDFRAEAEVLAKLQNLQLTKRELESKAVSIRDTFGSKVAEAKSVIRKLEDEYFPQFKDDTSYNTNEHLKNMSTVLKSKSLEQDLLFGMTSKMYATFMGQKDYISKLEKKLNLNKKSEEITKSAGPRTSEMKTRQNSDYKVLDPDKQVYKDEDFEAILRGSQ
jgi:hypothetical protein